MACTNQENRILPRIFFVWIDTDQMAPQAKPTCWPTVVAPGLAEATFFACGNAPRFGEWDLAPAILTGRRGTVVTGHGSWSTVLMAVVMGKGD